MKKAIWIFSGVLVAATLVMVALWKYESSIQPYSLGLRKVAVAVDDYQKAKGRLPTTLEDLGSPECLQIKGLPVAYVVTSTNAIVSLMVPDEVVHIRGESNSFHNSTTIRMDISLD